MAAGGIRFVLSTESESDFSGLYREVADLQLRHRHQ